MNMKFFTNVCVKLFLLSLVVYPNSSILCSNRSIDVENDSNYQMAITSLAPDLKIDHMIPANSHSKITAQVTSIPNLKNMLLNAILNNSILHIVYAIKAGASVNLEINGKKPLAWAILLNHVESIKCLISHGAKL